MFKLFKKLMSGFIVFLFFFKWLLFVEIGKGYVVLGDFVKFLILLVEYKYECFF